MKKEYVTPEVEYISLIIEEEITNGFDGELGGSNADWGDDPFGE